MKSIKYWVHVIAQVLLIVNLVIFLVPSVLTLVNWIAPIPEGELGGAFARLLASLSVVCFGVSAVPMLPELLLVFGVVLNLFDILWRRIRGHRFNKKQLIFTVCIFIMGVLGLFSIEYIKEVYTYVAIEI
ncbi:MAG: hypothetical protein IJC50_09080 [Clostridia bacterium]|nr:hypothetical protein [Clostridia bacterium]